MKQFLDFLPIVVFVGVYYLADIYYATAALMVAVTLQVGIMRLARQPIPQQLKVTFWLSLLFGGLTLVYQDKTFIQWKPTVVNWAMSAALIASHFLAERNLINRLFGSHLELPAHVWRRLNFGWAAGFFLAGAANLYVAYTFSEAFWVNYKLFGGFAITLVYVIATIVYLTVGGYVSEDAPGPEPREEGEKSR